MDKELFDLIAKKIPDINPRIANGFAVKEMEHAEEYLDKMLRSNKGSFPEGLEYIDFRRLNPVEEYIKATEPRSGKSRFDIARNDVYMVELEFRFNGEKILKPIYLPFARDGGLICLRGSTFAISPVLTDRGMSISANNIFIQIPKSKMTFRRTRHHFLANDERRSPSLVFSWLHNRNRKAMRQNGNPTVKANTTLMHYLFCKFGVKETFKRFCNVDVIIGENEINESEYPSDKWVICKTLGLKPKGLSTGVYPRSALKFVFRKEDFDTIIETMVSGLFYVIDLFPTRIRSEFLDGSVHEIRLWRVLLGHIIGGITGGEGSIYEAMNEHMGSLDSYIDVRARNSLAEGEIFVDEIYTLLYYVIEMMASNIGVSSDNISSLYDKKLVVLRYALDDLNNVINKTLFKLNKKASKKPLTYQEVSNTIKRSMSTDEVMKMNDGTRHGEITSVSSPGDNKFFKITSNVLLQTDSGSNVKKNKGTKLGREKFLHASIAEVCSYTVLPKSEPTGRGRINPWLQVDKNGLVLRNPDMSDIIDNTQKLIKRD